jgi:hypothetical protein
MQGRRERNHTAPSFLSRLPRTPSTLFSFPSNCPAAKKKRNGSWKRAHAANRQPLRSHKAGCLRTVEAELVLGTPSHLTPQASTPALTGSRMHSRSPIRPKRAPAARQARYIRVNPRDSSLRGASIQIPFLQIPGRSAFPENDAGEKANLNQEASRARGCPNRRTRLAAHFHLDAGYVFDEN